MEYNWEEIFKAKTDKELFEIVSGKSFLPESAILFAEKELEKRNFDFKNIDLYTKKWRLHSLEEDIDSTEDIIYEHKPLSLRLFFILSIVVGTVVALFVLRSTQVPNKIFIIRLTIAFMLFLSCIKYFGDKVIFNRQSKKLNKLTSNKLSILNDLDNNGLQFEKQKILEELKNESVTRYKRKKQFSDIVFILAILGLIVYSIIIYSK